ncbi:hypothetical protein N7495_007361 [Penicillium taxi]|uniref:uncharacterized protein n=1 Tax=Penicillium taxi TaxID=168475 RepID=UPI002545A0DB|nr:uncharacterized protein N7495_007361 [Penicillium taxi]KAJ5895670.1 hypothetical protein N7495_007361 [Penicillium taxi]
MDKSKQQHKPLTAAFHRSTKATNQPPLTPKLASPSPGYQTRRLANHDHPYSTPSKDDHVSTNVNSTFLSANITPRSGSRTLRRRDDLSNSPVPSPQAHYSHSTYSHPAVGLGLHAAGGVNGGRRTDRSPARGEQPNSIRAKPLTAEAQPASHPNSFHDLAANSNPSPMFFHASDARSSKPIHASDAPSSKSEVEPYRLKQGRLSPAFHSSQFVYANGDQEQQSSLDEPHPIVASRRLSGTLPRGGSTPIARPAASPSLRLRSPQISAAASPIERSQLSPLVDHTHDTTLHRFSSPPSNVSDSSDQPSISQHRKSSSVDFSAQPHTPSPLIASHNLHVDSTLPPTSDQAPRLRPRVFSNSSSLNGSSTSTDALPSMPMSPGKPEGPGGDTALNNARTERRILDLEISNSSLLAINRTLEREMRKQNAEIRRYRRLSRSGRISMVPSPRSFSGAALSVTSELEGVSECSSVHEASEFSDEDSVLDDRVHSPDSLAEHDAKHQAHDEKKFMLDLARHQELLIDSQKLNQSLKRCLGWTEELIKEGQKALEYSVQVQDVVLGGRVLAPEELPETNEARKGLLSPSTQYSDYSDYTSHPNNSDDNDTDPSTLPLPSSPGGTV